MKAPRVASPVAELISQHKQLPVPCVVGSCPLAMMPSHSCITFGIWMTVFVW